MFLDINDEYIILLVILILLLILLLFIPECEKFGMIEGFDDINKEAIQNVASIYNQDMMTIKNLKVLGELNLLPKGVIVAFNGQKIPDGWIICDGENGTPDLRARFILGSGDGSSSNLSNRNLNDKGGKEKHTLNINELPTFNLEINGMGEACSFNNCGSGRSTLVIDPDGKKPWKPKTNTIGKGDTFNIMPPFYVLTYIMKL